VCPPMPLVVFRCLAAIVLLGAALGAAAGGAEAARPNILFIMADDHAPSAISAYGSVITRTPQIDRLARDGMRFEHAYTTNSTCGPGRAAILTGKYSHVNGYRSNTGGRFDGTQQTFVKLLQQAGYQTAIIGKWHLNTQPTGFDFWRILDGEGTYNNPVLIDANGRQTVRGYVVDIVTDLTIDWLERRDKSRPFLLLSQHKAPHREWIPRADKAGLFAGQTIPTPASFNDDYATRGRAAREQTMTIGKDLTRQDLKADPPPGLSAQELKDWRYQTFIKDYLRVVAGVDENVGRLLDYLDKAGLTDNTLVVYTSDNGFFLGEHGWFDKRFMYEPGIRLPLLVRYPPRIKAGSSTAALAANIDFAPTFLDWAGVPIPPDIQGTSLRGIMEGRQEKVRDAFYYHYYEFPSPHRVQPHAGVRTDRYKLIHFYFIDEWELYDLQTDPDELHNVWNDPACAEVRRRMQAEFERAKQAYGDNDFAPRPGSMPDTPRP
jgi:arylsulfatase A-like enzyme